MSWQQELTLMGGYVSIHQTEEEDIYKVEGVVESGEEYLIWFQRLQYPDAERRLSNLSLPQMLHGDGVQPPWSLTLAPRILPTKGPQPTSFLALCDRLLAPQPREEWHGYVCQLSLQIAPASQVQVVISDRLNEPHEGDFVEFMHMQEPLTFIAHRKRFSFTSREMVELVLRLKHDWPLPYQASQ